jgi:hypothetical protein
MKIKIIMKRLVSVLCNKNVSIKRQIIDRHKKSREVPVELDTAAKVRPQKLFSAKMILAWFWGTPFTL